MPSKSPFPDVEIPDVDLWGLMFDRKSKDFADDKGTTPTNFLEFAHLLTLHSDLPRGRLATKLYFC